MYHRIVEVDSPGTRLRIENGSLKIETTDGRSSHFRTEELDCVLLSQPGVTLTNGALAELMAANVQMVAQIAPAEGIVNSFSFTDLEFERQDFLRDGVRSSPPAKPAQMEFF